MPGKLGPESNSHNTIIILIELTSLMALRLLFREKASILATSGSGMRQVDPPSRNAQRPPGIASQDITLNPLNRRQEERCSDSGFLELPFDVLLEIFSLLEPVDLLHLSSASRYLLRLLRSNDTLYIWTSVRFFFHVCHQPL